MLYNPVKRHSHTGGVSPVKFEEDYFSTLKSVWQTLESPYFCSHPIQLNDSARLTDPESNLFVHGEFLYLGQSHSLHHDINIAGTTPCHIHKRIFTANTRAEWIQKDDRWITYTNKKCCLSIIKTRLFIIHRIRKLYPGRKTCVEHRRDPHKPLNNHIKK